MSSDRLDSLGMFDATASLPEQIEAAVKVASEVDGLPDHDNIENVVVLGMGGSGIAGDFAAAMAGPFMPVPVVVQKGYAPPQFVNHRSLVFAVSFSGNTEETLEAANIAAIAGAHLVVVSAGGSLVEQAREWGAVHVPVDGSIVMPRAALGALAIPAFIILEKVGLFPGASEWVAEAVEHLKVRREELIAPGGEPEALARRIGRQLPIVYGGGSLGSVAAGRWKTQINENAKVAAFSNEVPELTHNEICGWGQHGDVTRQVFRMVHLRHFMEHPQVARRFDLIKDAAGEVVAGIEEVWAKGEEPLTELLDLIWFGDFVSLHLAYDAGVDPGPVPILDEIKAHLAQF